MDKVKSIARLAQSVERKALNVVVVGSGATVGASFYLIFLRIHEQTAASSAMHAVSWRQQIKIYPVEKVSAFF
jgi:hypothetical protein